MFSLFLYGFPQGVSVSSHSPMATPKCPGVNVSGNGCLSLCWVTCPGYTPPLARNHLELAPASPWAWLKSVKHNGRMIHKASETTLMTSIMKHPLIIQLYLLHIRAWNWKFLVCSYTRPFAFGAIMKHSSSTLLLILEAYNESFSCPPPKVVFHSAFIKHHVLPVELHPFRKPHIVQLHEQGWKWMHAQNTD